MFPGVSGAIDIQTNHTNGGVNAVRAFFSTYADVVYIYSGHIQVVVRPRL